MIINWLSLLLANLQKYEHVESGQSTKHNSSVTQNCVKNSIPNSILNHLGVNLCRHCGKEVKRGMTKSNLRIFKRKYICCSKLLGAPSIKVLLNSCMIAQNNLQNRINGRVDHEKLRDRAFIAAFDLKWRLSGLIHNVIYHMLRTLLYRFNEECNGGQQGKKMSRGRLTMVHYTFTWWGWQGKSYGILQRNCTEAKHVNNIF